MRNLLFVIAMTCLSLTLYSQTLVDTTQQLKNVVLEEFTGIHCQYCPQGHAVAQGILNANPGRVTLINIHEGGYATPATGEPDYRTSFGTAIANQSYLTGYPAGTVNRHYFAGFEMDTTNHGTAMGRSAWSTAASQILTQNAVVNLGVTSQFDTTTRNLTVTVEAYYTGNSATSQNFLNVVLLQDSIIGDQQNGTTWSTTYVHMHMLRDMITGQWGDTIFTTTQGTLVTHTYNYTVPTSFTSIPCNVNHCSVGVFITESHQEIENGIVINAVGGTNQYIGSLLSPSADVLAGSTGNTSTFSTSATSSLTGAQNFQFVLSSDAPSGWAKSFTVNGNNFSDTGVVSVANGTPASISISVVPDTTPFVATYTLKMTSVNIPGAPAKYSTMYVISNVTDLVVNGSGSPSWTGGTGAGDFASYYMTGLAYANNTHHASTSALVMKKAVNQNAIAGVHNIYANIAWTFPSLQDDETQALESFLNAGNNLFIAGQDLGWDIMSFVTGSNGDSITRDFYTNYLNASFIADGGTTNTPLKPVTTDAVFQNVTSSVVTYGVYGSGNMYPDQISPINGGVPIFYYGTTTTNYAGVRSFTGNHKIVYVAPGLEMLSTVTTRSQIIKQAHDWFWGLFSGINDLEKTSFLKVYPNPTSRNIYIDTKSDNFEVKIFDLSGNLIYNANSKNVIDISGFASGLYMVTVKEGNNISKQRISLVK